MYNYLLHCIIIECEYTCIPMTTTVVHVAVDLIKCSGILALVGV